MTERPTWAPDDVDPTRPSVARVYDFYLGGSHNFEADREFGRRALEAMPEAPVMARDNRAFLRRAVRFASAEGIGQFLDLGSGIPTSGNVHEVAREVDPQARVVYVDHDPVAVAHGQALLENDPQATTVRGDLREPGAVLDAATATGLLDLSRPVAILMVAVLHFVEDDADPAGLIRTYAQAAAPGSLVAVGHGRSGVPSMDAVARVYNQPGSPSRIRWRSLDEVSGLLGSLDVVSPGVVLLPHWHPELTGDEPREPGEDYPNIVGMGRRRA